MDADILVIGGGLAGLSLADRLHSTGQDWLLAEAAGHLGGRIRSSLIAGSHFDLGPAWFWPGQPRVKALIQRLGLEVFEQFHHGARVFQDRGGAVQSDQGFSSMEGSFRVAGGMGQLIEGLATALPARRLLCGHHVTALDLTGGRITATTAQGLITARQVVLALPPRLATETIHFSPPLPPQATHAARAMPTWMAGQAKILAVYDRPHWRTTGYSGDAFSQKGPMVEIHDASPAHGGPYALFGFVGFPPDTRARHKDEILDLAQVQLQELFGPEMADPLHIQMMDWAQLPTIATALDHTSPGGHPAYGLPPSLTDLWGSALHFSSTETAHQFGGYLEGALEAAERTSRHLTEAGRRSRSSSSFGSAASP